MAASRATVASANSAARDSRVKIQAARKALRDAKVKAAKAAAQERKIAQLSDEYRSFLKAMPGEDKAQVLEMAKNHVNVKENLRLVGEINTIFAEVADIPDSYFAQAAGSIKKVAKGARGARGAHGSRKKQK